MMEDSEWKFSNEQEVKEEYVSPVEGRQCLVIERADCDDNDIYTIYLQSLENDARFRLKYWMTKADEYGNAEPDSKVRRTLISLKKALYGPDAVGIPNPDCIGGTVVEAEVKLKKPNDKGIRYATIYTFSTAPGEIIDAFGNPEQYRLPEEDAE